MILNMTQIRDDGQVHYFGEPKLIKRLRKRGINVAIPCDHVWIGIKRDGDNITTLGPEGGSMIPYLAINWVWENVEDFGLYLSTPVVGAHAGVRCLFVELDNKAQAEALVAHINANQGQKPAAEAIADALLSKIGK